MSDTYQRRNTRQGHAEHLPRPEGSPEEQQPAEPTTFNEAESIRSGSQTAQDRDHTIRGGDDHTGPMKEFPT